ncbi:MULTISPECIES: hypothetical protein [Alphaproteobacteria]|nr:MULTISPECIES: hypothetical protein [Alphaproteobacteria]
MRALFLAIPMLIFATSVHALPKYTSTRMTCDRVQATIRQQGKVILTYPSIRLSGTMLYDTYVASQRFCRGGEITARISVPAADKPRCPVLRCRPDEHLSRSNDRESERSPNDPTHR